MTEAELLHEIEPTIVQAYDSHMFSAEKNGRPFNPAAILARATGTELDPLAYGPELRSRFGAHLETFAQTYGIDVRPVLAATFMVNLLTEDNLPHYTSRIQGMVQRSPALMHFSNEWTAEEDAHGVLMRDYALLSGMIGNTDFAVIDSRDYHTGRINQLRSGTEINPPNLFNAFAYLTLQELLTKEAHNKLSWILDPAGRQVMRPISGDEQNHYEFYRTLQDAALELDPDTTLQETERVYQRFRMPGKQGIPDFDKLSAIIGISGVFDLVTIRSSMQTIAKKIDVEGANPVSDIGKKAQERIVTLTSPDAIQGQQELMEQFREGQDQQLPNGLLPFVLGRTVRFTTIDTPAGLRITGIERIAA